MSVAIGSEEEKNNEFSTPQPQPEQQFYASTSSHSASAQMLTMDMDNFTAQELADKVIETADRVDEQRQALASESATATAGSVEVASAPDAVSSAAAQQQQHTHQQREAFLTRAIETAFAYMEASVLSSAPFMKVLQKKYKLFLLNKEKPGSWFVLFTAESCLRFIHAADLALPRYPLHWTLPSIKETNPNPDAKKYEPLFDWENAVFFAPLTAFCNYVNMEVMLRKGLNPDEPLPPDVAAMREKLQHNYRFYDCMSGEELQKMEENAIGVVPEKQICVTLMCVDSTFTTAATRSFVVDLEKVFEHRHYLLKRLATQYFMDITTCETALAVCMNARSGLNEQERRTLRQLPFAYARAVLIESGLARADEVLSPTRLATAIDAENAPCAYCSKPRAQTRCVKCILFRYCDDECRTRHAVEGMKGVREDTKRTGQFALTHMHFCMIARAASRMWGQMPRLMTADEFQNTLDDAREAYRYAVEKGMINMALVDTQTGEDAVTLRAMTKTQQAYTGALPFFEENTADEATQPSSKRSKMEYDDDDEEMATEAVAAAAPPPPPQQE